MDPEAAAAEDEKRARAAFATNLTVLPGLGTFLHGERLLGLAQAALGGAGFALICAWLLGFVTEAMALLAWPGAGPYAREGLLGLACCVGAAAWAGGTSYARWQEAKRRLALMRPRRMPP
jgi:hypothetical protein